MLTSSAASGFHIIVVIGSAIVVYWLPVVLNNGHRTNECGTLQCGLVDTKSGDMS